MRAIELNERLSVNASPERVWRLLSDPRLVAQCMPGTALQEELEDGSFSGQITLRFGPTAATFSGTAVMTLDNELRAGVIDARGADRKGSTRAATSTRVTVVPSGESCDVALDGWVDVSGPLAQFARTGGTQVLRAVLADFVREIERVAASAEHRDRTLEPAATTADASSERSAELRLGRLVWLMLRERWGRLRRAMWRTSSRKAAATSLPTPNEVE